MKRFAILVVALTLMVGQARAQTDCGTIDNTGSTAILLPNGVCGDNYSALVGFGYVISKQIKMGGFTGIAQWLPDTANAPYDGCCPIGASNYGKPWHQTDPKNFVVTVTSKDKLPGANDYCTVQCKGSCNGGPEGQYPYGINAGGRAYMTGCSATCLNVSTLAEDCPAPIDSTGAIDQGPGYPLSFSCIAPIEDTGGGANNNQLLDCTPYAGTDDVIWSFGDSAPLAAVRRAPVGADKLWR